MNYETDPTAPILVAMKVEWQEIVVAQFSKLGYRCLLATSREEAWNIIQSESLRGLIITIDLALSNEEDGIPNLVKSIYGKMPSVTIISNREGFDRLDEVYLSAKHQYCTAPFSMDEIDSYLRTAEKAEPGRDYFSVKPSD